MKIKIALTILLIIAAAFFFSLESDLTAQEDHDDHEGHNHEIHDDNDGHEEEEGDHEEHGHSEHEGEEHEDEHEGHDHEEAHLELSEKAIKLAGIETDEVKMGNIKKSIELLGEIGLNEDRTTHVVPRFSGIVLEVYKNLGDNVQKGDLLAKVESNESFSAYQVKSLTSGTIIEKHITVGEFVSEETIFVISDLSKVWINLDVYPKDEQKIRLGQEVDIELLGTEKKTHGKISYISPIYSQLTRNVIARIILPNSNGSWKPGAFVKGRTYTEASKEVPVVSADAVQIIDQETKVFIPEGDHEFLPVDVVIGEKSGKFVEIKSGLHVGDKYVSRGAFELKAKMITSSMDSHAGHGH